MKIPKFENKAETIDFLLKNKKSILQQKKNEVKTISLDYFNLDNSKNEAVKSIFNGISDKDTETEIYRTLAISNTKYIDSHSDVHWDGCFTKSLKENSKNLYLNENHEQGFRAIICYPTDLKVYNRLVFWRDLGYNDSGATDVLFYDATIKQQNNAFMFDLYKRDLVTNHSIEMRYIDIVMCLQPQSTEDVDDGAEREAWNKYYPEIVNKNVADELGYFFVVKELKILGAAAVPRGSNNRTPAFKSEELTEIEIIKTEINALKELINFKPQPALEVKEINEPQPIENNIKDFINLIHL